MSQIRLALVLLGVASSLALLPPALTPAVRLPCVNSGLLRSHGTAMVGCRGRTGPPGYLRLEEPHGIASMWPLGRARMHQAHIGTSVLASAASPGQPIDDQTNDADNKAPPPTPLLMLVVGLQSACFGCIGTTLPPALSTAGMEPAAIAILLGQIGSASAFAEVMFSNSFGKLADAIGRRPILLFAPVITAVARALVVVDPSIPVLIGVRFLTALAVPIYWLALHASNADSYSNSATKLAIIGSRIQAAMGLGYAISSIFGGWLAGMDIRLAYAASAFLGSIVFLLHWFFWKETLPVKSRVPFRWSGMSPLSFVQLFRRGTLSARLNGVVLLHSITNGMGDIWQVIARELRGWGAAQCGRFAALAGIASMVGTLLVGPSIRLLGARGHTVASSVASSACALTLAHATSNAMAVGAVVPMALGSGKGQAVSARIVNLGAEAGVPQGQLSAERQTLNALVRVAAPSLYAALFAFGATHGVLGLPFYTTALLLLLSASLAYSIPAVLWQSQGTLTKQAPAQGRGEGGREGGRPERQAETG